MPLVDENFYKQTNTEMGFSVDEIVRKLRDRQKDTMSYDDILDAISQINKKSAKAATGHNTVTSPTNGSKPILSGQHPNKVGVKLTDLVDLAPRSKRNDLPPHHTATPTGSININLREQKSRNYFLGNKNQKALNYTDNQIRSNHSKEQDILDELYATSDKNTTVELASPNKGSDKENNSFQHLSGDMNKLSDCSAIEHTERSENDSDWLASNDSNSEIKRVPQSESIFTGSISSQQGATKMLSTQSVSSPTASCSYLASDRMRNDSRQLSKVPSVEINRVMRPQPHFEESHQNSNSKNKSAQMLKQFLNTKTRQEQPAKSNQVKSYLDDQSSYSTNSMFKNDHSALETPGNTSRAKQRPPLAIVGGNSSATPTNQSLITPRNGHPQKVPITKVSLGKNSENPLTSPSKTSLALRESADIAKAGLNKSDLGSKPPIAQSVVSRDAKPVSEFYAKFLDLLTNFNTFYNENSSLISSTDISFINMINGYSIKHDFNNHPKVGVCFTEFESTEVKDMLIYPLLRTILCYVEVNSTLFFRISNIYILDAEDQKLIVITRLLF